jgi:hypothetical protein
VKRTTHALAVAGWFFLVASYHQLPTIETPLTFADTATPTLEASPAFTKENDCKNVLAALVQGQPSCFVNPANPLYGFGTCDHALFGCFPGN